MPKAHPLKGPNRFKLGVFSTNADGVAESHDPVVARNPIAACARMAAG